jgi:hypothetical protein
MQKPGGHSCQLCGRLYLYCRSQLNAAANKMSPAQMGTFTVHWNPRLHFWSLLDAERAKGRFWCCFGTDDPNNHKSPAIVCEINPPKEGYDRRAAGVLLRDDAGKIYLGHSGKIGGGRKGIGKSNFLSFYQGKLVTVQWPDSYESDLIVIGQVDGKQLVERVWPQR